MSDPGGGKSKFSRSDLLKLMGLGAAAVALRPFLKALPAPELEGQGEILKVGDLNIHFDN